VHGSGQTVGREAVVSPRYNESISANIPPAEFSEKTALFGQKVAVEGDFVTWQARLSARR